MSTQTQRSLAAGEIAPALYPRTDTTRYASGLRVCRNNRVMRHGGTESRPGTEFVGEVRDSSKTVRLLPFIFNSSNTYVLEFGDLYVRFIKNGDHIKLSAQNITGVTNANPGVLTYSGSDTFANGDHVYVSGIIGAIGTYLNGRTFKVASVNAGANTFQLNYLDGTAVNTTAMGSYTSGGTIEEIYTVTTTYVEADLPALKFVQSADVITIVHPSYAPKTLTRTSDASWALATITFEPGVVTPSPAGASTGFGPNPETAETSWSITAVSPEGEESLPGGIASGNIPGSPQSLFFTRTAGTNGFYRVYRRKFNVMGFIGKTSYFQQDAGLLDPYLFIDTGLTPDVNDNPPSDDDLFQSSNNYPSAVAYVQQRLMLANSNNDPEVIWASRIGQFTNFTYKAPIRDDDRLQFNLVGKQVNRVKHILDVAKPLIFTEVGIWSLEGDSAGSLIPSAINPKQQAYTGAGDLPPLIVGGNAVYVQARGSIVRDLSFEFSADGYRGNDLTVFSAHLFDGYTLTDWTYQETPHSVIWAVRDDGTLLGLTYVREQQIIGWHRHDTDGEFESVCAIPEGNEDALYVAVKRTVNGATKRYIERFSTRQVRPETIADFIGMDSALSYDGRNTGSTTMTLSGSGWTFQDTLTLTASASFFSSSDVGNQIHLNIVDDDGLVTEVIRCEITAYTSATVVSVRPNRTVPAALRASATTHWGRAVDDLSGLWHLEGKDVSVFADGFVVASPNNAKYQTITVTHGAITLTEPQVVIHVGLPYLCDLEALDIDTPEGESLAGRKKQVSKVTVHVEKTRGVFIGRKAPSDDSDDPLEGLYEAKVRDEESYDDPVALKTGTTDVIIQPGWDSNGRVFIRQVDPVPMAILAITPEAMVPARGGG